MSDIEDGKVFDGCFGLSVCDSVVRWTSGVCLRLLRVVGEFSFLIKLLSGLVPLKLFPLLFMYLCFAVHPLVGFGVLAVVVGVMARYMEKDVEKRFRARYQIKV